MTFLTLIIERWVTLSIRYAEFCANANKVTLEMSAKKYVFLALETIQEQMSESGVRELIPCGVQGADKKN